jgi:hypothetical protein
VFDFTVEHRPGTHIRHASAISRAFQSFAHAQDFPRENAEVEQETYKYCRSLKLGNEKGKSEYFANRDEVIYRHKKKGEHKLLVPASLVKQVICMNHDPVTIVHPGRNRTLDTLSQILFPWYRWVCGKVRKKLPRVLASKTKSSI